MPVNIEFTLGSDYPILSEFMLCRSPVSICRGPLGSSKTTSSVQRLMMHMEEQEPGNVGGRWERRTRMLAIRNTYSDLRETTIKDFLGVFGEGQIGRMRWDDPPQYHAAFRLPDGSHVNADVIFLALDRPDSVRKLKGYQTTVNWLNETSELDKSVVDMADLRHGRYPNEIECGVRPTWHGQFGDTNSYDSTHWLAKLEKNPPPGWTFFVQPGGVIQDEEGRWVPNPLAENLKNLPHDYYTRGMSGKDESWIKVMLGNQIGFTVRGRPVHPRFNFDTHVAKRPLVYDQRYPLILGLDFGRTPAAVVMQHIESVGRYQVLAELTSENMSASIFAPELKRMIERRWPSAAVQGWGDPAGDAQGQATEDTPILICRAAGLPVRAAPSNVWALRRAALDNVLTRLCMDGKPAFLVDPSCEMLIKGLMGGYHYRELQVSGPEPRFADAPEKNEASHVCFAPGTQIDTPGGRVAIEALKVGDLVCTPLGPRPVAFAGAREASRVRLGFSDGAALTCTPDHPFLSASGRWVHAEALQYADILLSKETPRWIQYLCLRSAQARSTRSTNSRAFASTLGRLLATTSRAMSTAIDTCIAWSGLALTGPFPRAITSTTATATPQTIDSRTWSASWAPSTVGRICWSRTASRTRAGRYAGPSSAQWSGASETPTRPGRSGCAVSPDSARRKLERGTSRSSASAAARPTRSTSSMPLAASSALRAARLPFASLLEWTTSTPLVLRAAGLFARIATSRARPVRLLARERSSPGIVHNLEVSEAHCYYAGGLLVSNCESAHYALLGAGEGRAALRPAEPQLRAEQEARWVEREPYNELSWG